MLNVKHQLVEMNVGPGSAAVERLALRNASPQVTMQQFDWPGLRIEEGINNIAAVDEVAGVHHYVSLNLDDRPVTFEVKGSDEPFQRFVLRRGAAWICPAGEPISIRVNSDFRYMRMSIDPVYFDRLVSGDPASSRVELKRTYGVANSQIGHILGALVAESDAGNPGGLAFVEALATGMSHQLAHHAGVRTPAVVLHRGGLSAAARRRALELIDAQPDANLTVQFLAGEVGLSPAHFARAFKETMGITPHQYLLHTRLERSRRLLEADNANLSEVAQRVGFADQSHFTRLFKREYGVTPGAVLRRRRLPPSVVS
ncbi:MAG TPA: AraC family transcriptional regulator [Gemmatimonadaceae bacterium]|nr:AraC family transcriptional regulator [Gemmatimonadaceae bacterium]